MRTVLALFALLTSSPVFAFDWYVQADTVHLPVGTKPAEATKCFKVDVGQKHYLPSPDSGWSCVVELAPIDSLGPLFRQFGEVVCQKAEDRVSVIVTGVSSSPKEEDVELTVQTKSTRVSYTLSVNGPSSFCSTQKKEWLR